MVKLANVSQISANWIAQEALADLEPTWLPLVDMGACRHQLIVSLKPRYDVNNDKKRIQACQIHCPILLVITCNPVKILNPVKLTVKYATKFL